LKYQGAVSVLPSDPTASRQATARSTKPVQALATQEEFFGEVTSRTLRSPRWTCVVWGVLYDSFHGSLGEGKKECDKRSNKHSSASRYVSQNAAVLVFITHVYVVLLSTIGGGAQTYPLAHTHSIIIVVYLCSNLKRNV
jgi:hypothetical protein